MDKISLMTYEGLAEALVLRDLAKDPRTRHLSDGQFADVARHVLEKGGEHLRPKSDGTFASNKWDGDTPGDFLTELLEDKNKQFLFTDLSKQDEAAKAKSDQFGGMTEAEFMALPAKRRLEIANEAAAKGQ